MKRARTLVVLMVLMLATITPFLSPTMANTLGPPRKNIEENNCYCHSNAVTGKNPDPAVTVFIDPASPDKIVTNGNSTISVSIEYENATVDTKYGFTVDLDSLDGKSLDGAGLKTPLGTASENRTHLSQSQVLDEKMVNITLTAPKVGQRMAFNVVGMVVDNNGVATGDHWNVATKEIEVFKKREIIINTTVRNTGDIDAIDINLTIFVDGEEIGIEQVPMVHAGGEENVTHTWDATFFKPGEYLIEVEIDSNHTTIELDDGNNRLSKVIVLESLEPDTREYDWTTVGYYLIGAIFILLIIGIIYRRLA